MLLGIAMGRVGMSMDDFCRCAPSEFSRIVEAYRLREETAYRAGWEQTRIQVVSVANMFSKHPLRPEKTFPLPWDEKKQAPKGSSSLERMREVATRSGLYPRGGEETSRGKHACGS